MFDLQVTLGFAGSELLKFYSRLAQAFGRWRRYDRARQLLMRTQLERMLAAPKLSRDVYELASKSLKSPRARRSVPERSPGRRTARLSKAPRRSRRRTNGDGFGCDEAAGGSRRG